MRKNWATNSLEFSSQQQNFPLLFFTIAFSSFVIVHSGFINGTKFHGVRQLTEVAAWCTLGHQIFKIIACHDPTTLKSAILVDLFGTAILSGCAQLCDNYMFYYRFLACKPNDVSKMKRYTIHCFIWLILIATWIPGLTILPIFYNTNTEQFWINQYPFISLQTWSLLAYNMYFSCEFGLILCSWNRGQLPGAIQGFADARIIISIKSIAHCLLSGSTCSLWLFYPWGSTAYSLSVLFSLHFLFNYKLEKYLTPNHFRVRPAPSPEVESDISVVGSLWLKQWTHGRVATKTNPSREPGDQTGHEEPIRNIEIRYPEETRWNNIAGKLCHLKSSRILMRVDLFVEIATSFTLKVKEWMHGLRPWSQHSHEYNQFFENLSNIC